MMTQTTPPEAMPGTGSLHPERRSPGDIRIVDVADIVGASREAVLMHDGQAYRLRITSNRKLILTK